MSRIKQTFIILTPGFPSSESDSTCLPMQQAFVRRLQTEQPYWHIIILSFQYPYIQKTYSWFGNTVICFNGRNSGGLSRIFLRNKIETTLSKIHNSAKIAGILSFWYGECARVGQRFAQQHGLKHYCWILGQDARKNNSYPRRLKMQADKLLALSDFLKEEFQKNYRLSPLHVIPFGMEVSANTDCESRSIDILAAGSLIPLKQYELFIEIIANLKKERAGIKAVLAGDGQQKRKLLELIYKKELESNIELPGEIPHAELLKKMRQSKLFLHTSSYEGFSGVCLEALASGCQVISFCKPMKKEMEHWHIVNSIDEMQTLAREILKESNPDFSASVPYTMRSTVQEILKLYPAPEQVHS